MVGELVPPATPLSSSRNAYNLDRIGPYSVHFCVKDKASGNQNLRICRDVRTIETQFRHPRWNKKLQKPWKFKAFRKPKPSYSSRNTNNFDTKYHFENWKKNQILVILIEFRKTQAEMPKWLGIYLIIEKKKMQNFARNFIIERRKKKNQHRMSKSSRKTAIPMWNWGKKRPKICSL